MADAITSTLKAASNGICHIGIPWTMVDVCSRSMEFPATTSDNAMIVSGPRGAANGLMRCIVTVFSKFALVLDDRQVSLVAPRTIFQAYPCSWQSPHQKELSELRQKRNQFWRSTAGGLRWNSPVLQGMQMLLSDDWAWLNLTSCSEGTPLEISRKTLALRGAIEDRVY